ncbi:endolytic transglycosylase MltG [Pelagibius marinus]|uniref:endolytic transglycosylase MltG n=1 Tax=Pelagibius marinus TaxID=2762760 RepID=UPI0018731BC1|nr:endolytic transglycosylase MltG [Pelagibius marinus]
MRRLGGIAIAVVVVLLLAAGGSWFFLKLTFEEPGPVTEEVVVVVPRGAGLAAIADDLAEAGVVSDPTVFRLGVRLFADARALQAGEYAFTYGMSMKDVAELLASGRTVVHRLTVPEGLTSVEIVALLDEAEALDGEIGEVPPDGTLLPETYHFHRGDSRADILARMRQSMTEALAEVWEQRAENLPLKSPEEALVLASIVEKETGVDGERALVAGVFVNRLDKGMPLQSDPTVVYGITLGKAPLGRSLTRQDLANPTPYNTYQISGLPPGPIANPGRAALEAAVNPAETEFLYFVAAGDGGHAFAKTLAEHNRNVAKWRKHLRSLKKKQTD